MGLRSVVPWLAWAALPWLPGCTTTDAFACNADAQCVSDGQAGRCEAEGVCSFPDDACPSGRRYGLLAGELAGECVGGGASEGTADPGATSVSTLEPMETADESSGPSATSTSTSTSTTEPTSMTEPGPMTSTSSMTSMTATTEPETTGSGTTEPYGPCTEDADCPVMGSLCVVGPSMSSVCVPPCTDEPCEPEGNAVEPACFPVNTIDGCIFICMGADQCPRGMICEPVEGIGYCAWEPGTGP